MADLDSSGRHDVNRPVPLWEVVRAILWTVSVLFLLGLGRLFPNSELVQTYFVGPHGLFQLLAIAGLAVVIWLVEWKYRKSKPDRG